MAISSAPGVRVDSFMPKLHAGQKFPDTCFFMTDKDLLISIMSIMSEPPYAVR